MEGRAALAALVGLVEPEGRVDQNGEAEIAALTGAEFREGARLAALASMKNSASFTAKRR